MGTPTKLTVFYAKLGELDGESQENSIKLRIFSAKIPRKPKKEEGPLALRGQAIRMMWRSDAPPKATRGEQALGQGERFQQKGID